MAVADQEEMGPINEFGDVSGSLFRSILLWAITLFALVETALIVAVIRFRRSRTGSGGDIAKGHRGLEFAWTLAPALILLAIGVPAVYTLFQNTNSQADSNLRIEVIGHPWGWEFHYPQTGVTTTEKLHLPVGRPAHLTLTAEESVHSFRIPGLGGKWDLIPGRTNHIWVKPEVTEVISLPCPQACAGTHEQMEIVVESEAEFQRWLTSRMARQIDSAAALRNRAGTGDPRAPIPAGLSSGISI
jgi:cytochrome c oxidase subunit 2